MLRFREILENSVEPNILLLWVIGVFCQIPNSYIIKQINYIIVKTYQDKKSTRHYEVAEEVDDVNLFCLYMDSEPLNFQKAIEEEVWRFTMKEEIN